MTVNAGEEFNLRAAPDQELLRKLSYLSGQDSESVLTGGIQSPRGFGREPKAGKRDGLADSVQLLTLEEQQRQERLRRLNERLDELDRQSLQAMKEAEERLEEVKENANRTKDGRLAFETEDGSFRDKNGDEIDPAEIDPETYDPDASKWGEFSSAQEGYDDAREFRESVLKTKDQVTKAEQPSDDDLDGFEQKILNLETSAPDYSTPDNLPEWKNRSTSAARDYIDAADDRTAVKVQEPFSKAASPDISEPSPDPAPEPERAPATSFTVG